MAKSTSSMVPQGNNQDQYRKDLQRYKSGEIIWNPVYYRQKYGLNATQGRQIKLSLK